MRHPEAILARAIQRHGGPDRWRRPVTLHVQRLSGLVPWMKGLGRTFRMPDRLVVDAANQRVEAPDFPKPGQTLVYDHGFVFAAGEARPEHPRRVRFRGLAKLRRWDDHDALYFFGAALCTYLAVPFILPQQQVIARRRWRDLDAVWVRFPADFHTHGPVQGFYFDGHGLLRRHDYHAEILGPLTYGAHMSDDYVELDGLPVATRRRVYWRFLPGPTTLRTPIPVLSADLTVS